MYRIGKTFRGGSRDAATAPIYSISLPVGSPVAANLAYSEGKLKLHPAWLWAKLTVAFGLLEVTLWTQGERQHLAALVFISWIALTALLGPRPRELGLGLSGIRGALVAIPMAMLAAGVILLTGWLLGTLRPLYGARPALSHSLGYATWAMVQQFILNSYFFVTLERLLRSARAAMWGAVLLFTLAHIPNPVLLVSTFVGAIFFVSVFRRYRNIYPLGIAHAMLGLSLAATVPDVFMHHMRVGISYFHFVLVH